MTRHDRRTFLRFLGALGGCFVTRAVPPFVPRALAAAAPGYRFPQGVASGDPTPESVVLWTRVEARDGSRRPVTLRTQVSRSPSFDAVVVDREHTVTEESDHTLRLLVDGLEPGTRYFYRFVAGGDVPDVVGRTFTAPLPDDPSPVRFAAVSCQHRQLGTMTPYRRMIEEDEARDPDDRIRFVLHLGDFIYEEIWYPEEEEVFLRRPIRDTVRLPHGGRLGTLRYPVTLEDYRAVYRAYLEDPDLRAARARWPFVCTWDDHEFSNNSWQSQAMYRGDGRPAQSRKVAANQAWFEYVPAFLTGNPGVEGVDQGARDFTPVRVNDVPIEGFDEQHRSLEPNNRAAIESLLIYRSLRWGRNVELVVTDNRSFRSPPVPSSEIERRIASRLFGIYPERILHLLDAGRTRNGGDPPASFTFDGETIPNPRRDRPAGTVLGPEQKRWWKETIRRSDATWKVWANPFGTLTRRVDAHNLTGDLRDAWRGRGYGVLGNDDWESYDTERDELIRFARENAIGNLVSLAGDRHSFTAGYLSGSLETGSYDPVAVEFGVSSITTPTPFEAFEYIVERRPDLEPLYVRREGDRDVPVMNLLFLHGVAAALEYARTGERDAALARSNPDVGRHLTFLDMASHGYATVEVGPDAMETEFVGMNRPLEPTDDPAGPPVVYRVAYRVDRWDGDESPVMRRVRAEGALPFPVGE